MAMAPSRAGTLKELLVAAAKKDSLQQYREIISSAGFEPLFAIAALAREGVCSHRPGHCAFLEIGGSHSELVTFDESGPATLRVLALGAEHGSANPLLNALRGNGTVEKIFVAGKAAAIWSARIAPNIPAEPLPGINGQSTAIHGLQESLRRGVEPLLIHTNRESTRVQRAPAQWRWAAAACALVLISIGLRFADPIVRKARIRSTIAELEARRAQLPKVDREAGFLNYIHSNQPDYLDIIGALASAAQPGMKLDSLTISRRGEIGLRGSAQGGQAATTLRSKMIDSGYFASVVIDEQTPVQNQQQVNFRMTAQARPEAERKIAVASKPKIEKTGATTNKLNAPPGSAPQPGVVAAQPAAAAEAPAAVQLPPGVVIQREAVPQ
jgi:hypothetical protein